MITEILETEYAYIFSKWSYQVLEFQKLPKLTPVNPQKIFYEDIFWKNFEKVLSHINLYQKNTVHEFCKFLVSYKSIFQTTEILKKYIQNILVSIYYSDRRYRIVENTFYDLYYIVLPEIQLHTIQTLQFLNNIIQKPISETRKFLKSCKNTCNKLGIPFHNIDIVSKNRYNTQIIYKYIPTTRNYILAQLGENLFRGKVNNRCKSIYAQLGKKLFSQNVCYKNKITKINNIENIKNIKLLVIGKKIPLIKYKQD